MTPPSPRFGIPGIALFALVLVLLWSALVGVSAGWNYRQAQSFMLDQAFAAARTQLNTDISIRRWGTRQGGLYVPLGAQRTAVPWLKHPRRDLTTADGQRLTLINPATMVREVMEEYAEGYGVVGRITGLAPLNPANRPDPWERDQLQRFGAGQAQESWQVSERAGAPHLRFLRAMVMEPGCEACHPDVALDSVVGAIGVTLPLQPYYRQLALHAQPMLVSHGLIWAAGLLVVVLGARAVYRQERNTERLRHRYQLIFEQSMDGVLLVDPENGRFSEFNPRAHQQLGYSAAEFAALNLSDIEALETPPQTRRHIERVCARGWDQFETQQRHKDGGLRDIHVVVRRVELEGRTMLHAAFRDITQRKRAERQAEQEQRRFLDMVNTTEGIVWEADARSFNFTFVSDKAERLLGYPVSDWYQPGFWAAHLHPEDRDWATAFCAACTERREPHDFEYRIIAADGATLWLRDMVTPVEEAGRPRWLRGIMLDITAQREAQAQLRAERDRSQLYLDTVPSLVVALDRDGRIRMINRFGCELLGYREAELLGQDWFGTCLPQSEQLPRVRQFFAQIIAGDAVNPGYFENEVRTATGARLLLAWRNSLLYDSHGAIRGTLSAAQDITERKAAEQEAYQLAFYDVLTGLPNRRLLRDRLQQSLADSARGDSYKALLFMDLDNFKTLNDTLGHECGDQVLVDSAHRILSCVREVDTVSRHGGDEFIVLLEHLGSDPQLAAKNASLAAEKIIAFLRLPYPLGEQSHQSSVSIGIALFHGAGNSVEELLKRADVAMYQAKGAGRNTYQFYDPEMQADIAKRAALERDLRRAISAHEFELYYQPQVDRDERCVGAEALIRWRSPTRGPVSPLLFIPLAEQTQLILAIGRWVLEQACRQLALWSRSPETASLVLAVNVSALEFRQADFADRVLEQVQGAGIDPTRLKLELTESMLVDDVERVIAKMERLKAEGIAFSLDDFGTGYSSLSYVKRLPLDQLKIDQSFVRDILVDSNDAAICRAVIAMGQTLGLHTIAEGVEEPGQWRALLEHGCLGGQGYLYARPMPIGEFSAWLAARQRTKPGAGAAPRDADSDP